MSSLRASGPGSNEIGNDHGAEEGRERAVRLVERFAKRLYFARVVLLDHRAEHVARHFLYGAAGDVPAAYQRLSELFWPRDGLWCER